MPDEHHWNWAHGRQELADMLDRLTPEQAYQVVRSLCMVEDEAHLAPVLSALIHGHVARNEAERKRGGDDS
jgi:hypothetical protein